MTDMTVMPAPEGGVDESLVRVLEETAMQKILEKLELPLQGIVREAVTEALVHAIHGDHRVQLTRHRKPSSTGATLRVPKAGGRCAAVWSELDKLRARAAGVVPALKDILRVGQRRKWNVNNTRVEYYQWRKHNGVSGRLAQA